MVQSFNAKLAHPNLSFELDGSIKTVKNES
jgi:hypothetical protein